MCSLCGMLGGRGHWTDTGSNPEVFQGAAEAVTRQRERQGRVRVLNRILGHYGLSVDDWQGTSYILRNGRGQSEIVESLADLWPTAESMARRLCDPLDHDLLDVLARDLSR